MDLLDNPGGGDCMFYALSAGLINAIQTLPELEARDLWVNWASQGKLDDSVTFETIKAINLKDKPTTVNDLNFKLQHSIRNIAAQAMKMESNGLFAEQYDTNSTKYKEKEKKIIGLNEKLKEFDRLDKEVDLIKKTIEQEEVPKAFEQRINVLKQSDGNQKQLNELIQQRNAYIDNQIMQTKQGSELHTLKNKEEFTELRSQRNLLTSNRLEIDPVYSDFRLLVQFYKNNPSKEDQLINQSELDINIFSDSIDVKNLAKAVANNTKKFKGAELDEHVIKVFSAPSNRNKILLGIDSIKTDKKWGKTDQSTAVLNALGVNSNIEEQVNGVTLQNKTNQSFGKDAPFVKLVNKNNVHWVTDLEIPKPILEQAPEVETPIPKHPTPTKSESHEVSRADIRAELIRKTSESNQIAGDQQLAEQLDRKLNKQSYSRVLSNLKEPEGAHTIKSNLKSELDEARKDKDSYYNKLLRSGENKKDEELDDGELAARLQEKEYKGPS